MNWLFCLKWDPCELQERREKGVFRAAHPHTPFLGQCPPRGCRGSKFPYCSQKRGLVNWLFLLLEFEMVPLVGKAWKGSLGLYIPQGTFPYPAPFLGQCPPPPPPVVCCFLHLPSASVADSKLQVFAVDRSRLEFGEDRGSGVAAGTPEGAELATEAEMRKWDGGGGLRSVISYGEVPQTRREVHR